MSYYVVCQKKRNNPRMDVRICRKKCELKDECAEYHSVNEILIRDENINTSEKIDSIQMEAA